MIMVPVEKRFYLLRQVTQLFHAVLVPAEAFHAHRAVEALNERLLVLLVRTRNPVTAAEERSHGVKLSLELTAAIGLDRLHKASESAQSLRSGAAWRTPGTPARLLPKD